MPLQDAEAEWRRTLKVRLAASCMSPHPLRLILLSMCHVKRLVAVPYLGGALPTRPTPHHLLLLQEKDAAHAVATQARHSRAVCCLPPCHCLHVRYVVPEQCLACAAWANTHAAVALLCPHALQVHPPILQEIYTEILAAVNVSILWGGGGGGVGGGTDLCPFPTLHA